VIQNDIQSCNVKSAQSSDVHIHGQPADHKVDCVTLQPVIYETVNPLASDHKQVTMDSSSTVIAKKNPMVNLMNLRLPAFNQCHLMKLK